MYASVGGGIPQPEIQVDEGEKLVIKAYNLDLDWGRMNKNVDNLRPTKKKNILSILTCGMSQAFTGVKTAMDMKAQVDDMQKNMGKGIKILFIYFYLLFSYFIFI